MTDRLGAQGTVLGGGRYDGLMETLGGPHTPAVGWAAGIERLAMLVLDAGKVAIEALDVVLAVEDDRALSIAQKTLAQLRRAGFSADMIASGSPRKRFDKAVKMDARVILGLAHDDNQVVRSLRGPKDWTAKIDQIVHPLIQAQA